MIMKECHMEWFMELGIFSLQQVHAQLYEFIEL